MPQSLRYLTLGLPAGFYQTGNITAHCCFQQLDPAQAALAVVTVRTTGDATAITLTNRGRIARHFLQLKLSIPLRISFCNVIKEARSRNTWENACFSSELLAERGMDEVMLISDRAHLPRALLCFQSQGVLAQAAWSKRLPKQEWVPSAGALSMVPEIWYEWLALVWYHVRYL